MGAVRQGKRKAARAFDEKIQGYYLDNQDDSKSTVVSGRDELLEILLKENQELKKSEDSFALHSDPAMKLV